MLRHYVYAYMKIQACLFGTAEQAAQTLSSHLSSVSSRLELTGLLRPHLDRSRIDGKALSAGLQDAKAQPGAGCCAGSRCNSIDRVGTDEYQQNYRTTPRRNHLRQLNSECGKARSCALRVADASRTALPASITAHIGSECRCEFSKSARHRWRGSPEAT